MNYLTIGEMAELNCVTKKTLRLYHSLGVLVPAYLDESNGRRYYTEDQRYQLDLIQRLQAIGLSLSEIKEALEDSTPEQFIALLENQLAANEQKLVSFNVALNTNRELLDGARMRTQLDEREKKAPTVQIKECPAFPMLVFTCEELGIPPIEYGMHPGCLAQWSQVMASTKQAVSQLIEERGLDIPTSLMFHRVGVIGEKGDRTEATRTCSKVFVGIDASLTELFERSTAMPAGTYLSLDGECDDVVSTCGGQCMTKVSMDRLFNFAEKHRFKTDGLCYTECLPDPLALRSTKVETLNRTRLRILDE